MSIISLTASDEHLKLLSREGDKVAFEQLYHRHKDPLYRFVVRQCNNEDQAQDIVQDVWLSIHKACDGYVPTAKFTTWIYRIAHNRLIDFYRRSKNGLPISYDDENLSEQQLFNLDSRYAPDQLAESAEQSEQLLLAIAHLQEAQREVALLHFEMGFNVSEIANITQTNPETAKSRLRYALKKIRQQVLS